MRTALAALGGLVGGLAIAGGAFVILDDGDEESPSSSVPQDRPERVQDQPEREGDVIVFLDQEVTEEERLAVEGAVAARPDVVSYEYWDHEESLAEARDLFRDNGEMLAKITEEPEMIPASYRLDVAGDDVEAAGRVANDLEALPGVIQVTVAG